MWYALRPRPTKQPGASRGFYSPLASTFPPSGVIGRTGALRRSFETATCPEARGKHIAEKTKKGYESLFAKGPNPCPQLSNKVPSEHLEP